MRDYAFWGTAIAVMGSTDSLSFLDLDFFLSFWNMFSENVLQMCDSLPRCMCNDKMALGACYQLVVLAA